MHQTQVLLKLRELILLGEMVIGLMMLAQIQPYPFQLTLQRPNLTVILVLLEMVIKPQVVLTQICWQDFGFPVKLQSI